MRLQFQKQITICKPEIPATAIEAIIVQTLHFFMVDIEIDGGYKGMNDHLANVSITVFQKIAIFPGVLPY